MLVDGNTHEYSENSTGKGGIGCGWIDAYFTESVEDEVGIGSARAEVPGVDLLISLLDGLGALQLGNQHGCRAHDISETRDQTGEWALSDNDQGRVDEGDALGRRLKVLGLLGDHFDAVGDLLGSGGGHGCGSQGEAGEDLGEEHGDGLGGLS